jgi:RecG-like helicase
MGTMGRNGVSATGTGQEPPAPRRAGFGRALRRLLPGTATLDTSEPWDDAGEADATPISDCNDRDWVNVDGTIRSVTLRPHGAAMTLEADLSDGTGEVTLVWFGRDEIHGVKPGRHVAAHGRLCCPGGRPTIFNPRYELRSPPAR